MTKNKSAKIIIVVGYELPKFSMTEVLCYQQLDTASCIAYLQMLPILHLSFIFFLLTSQSFMSCLNELLHTHTILYYHNAILPQSGNLQNSYHGNCPIFVSACEQCQLSRYRGMFCHVILSTKWSAIPSKVTTQLQIV